MSWRDRAVSVESGKESSWRDRATPVAEPTSTPSAEEIQKAETQGKVDSEFDKYLQEKIDAGENPAEHPIRTALGGLVNKAIPSIPEAVDLAGENAFLGLGRYPARLGKTFSTMAWEDKPFSEAWEKEKAKAVDIQNRRPEANVLEASIMNLGADKLIGAAGKSVGKVFPKLSVGKVFPKLKAALDERAALSAIKEAKKLGYSEPELAAMNFKSKEDLINFGKELIERGAIKGKNTAQALQAAGKAEKKSGARAMEMVRKRIDETGKRFFYPQKTASDVKKLVGEFSEGDALVDPEVRMASKVIKAAKSRGLAPTTLEEAQVLKNEINPLAQYNKLSEPASKARLGRSIERGVASQIEEAVGRGAKYLDDPSLVGKFEEGKGAYGFGAQLGRQKGINKQALRESLPGDGIKIPNDISITKALLSGPEWLINKGIKASQNVGTLRSVSRHVDRVQKMMTNPAGIQKLGPYAAPLLQASQRGPEAFAVTNYLLQQKKPEYREMVRQLDEEGDY